MAVKLNTKEYGQNPYHDKAMYGNQQATVNITPRYGNTGTWTQDAPGWGMSGDMRNFWKVAGTNGKDHEQICRVGRDSGFYPNGSLVLGIKFEVQQDSTAGRAMWFKHAGAMSWQDRMWSSGAYSKKNDYNWHEIDLNFSSDFLSHIKSTSGYIKYIMLHFSCHGGSTTRTSEVHIRNFRFKWINGISGKTLILPKLRSYSDRAQIQYIA